MNFTLFTPHPDAENKIFLDTDPIFLKSKAGTFNISEAGRRGGRKKF